MKSLLFPVHPTGVSTAGLFRYWLATITSSTERAKSRFWRSQYIDYGYEIPDNSMVILLGLVYSVIAPIIAPIALAYFLVTSLIYKYQALYMNTARFQSGGNVRPSLLRGCIGGI